MTQDIAQICKNFGKRPLQFTDNAACNGYSIESRRGRNGFTKIPDELLPEFLLWLSPETRQMLPLKGIEETLKFAKEYKK